jgi:hypothetical protein
MMPQRLVLRFLPRTPGQGYPVIMSPPYSSRWLVYWHLHSPSQPCESPYEAASDGFGILTFSACRTVH